MIISQGALATKKAEAARHSKGRACNARGLLLFFNLDFEVVFRCRHALVAGIALKCLSITSRLSSSSCWHFKRSLMMSCWTTSTSSRNFSWSFSNKRTAQLAHLGCIGVGLVY